MEGCRTYIFNIWRVSGGTTDKSRKRDLLKQITVFARNEQEAREFARDLHLRGNPGNEMEALGPLATSEHQ